VESVDGNGGGEESGGDGGGEEAFGGRGMDHDGGGWDLERLLRDGGDDGEFESGVWIHGKTFCVIRDREFG